MKRIPRELVVVDVETTGIDPFVHKVISLALVPLHPERQALSIFVRYDEELVWSRAAKAFFERDVRTWEAEAVRPLEAIRRIEKFGKAIGPQPITLIGHNIGFDVAFLKQLAHGAGYSELPFVSHRMVDTHSILYCLYLQGRIPRDALSSSGAFEYFGISPPPEQRHTALGDAMATRLLFNSAFELLLAGGDVTAKSTLAAISQVRSGSATRSKG